MKIRTILQAIACLTLAAATLQAADASEVIYDGSGFMRGQQSFVDSFTVDGPGILTVTLSDVAWPEPLAALNLVMSTPQGLLGPEMGLGTANFEVTAAGSVFAQWFGTAQGPLNTGVFGVKVEFTPAASVVALPASFSLLLSGLALLAWLRLSRRLPPNGATCGHLAATA